MGRMTEQTGPGQPAIPAPAFRGIDHVGIAVHDMDAAIKEYEQRFGMRVTHVEENHDQGVVEAMLAVGAGGGPPLQLLAPLREDSPLTKFLADRGEGVQQIAYTVDDIAIATAILRERGVEVLYDEPRAGTAGSRVNFIHPKNAGGVLVELVEQAREDGTTRRQP
jgi:methylmalonyl-CoA/ethylmalonyl-CoA epimerase